MSVIPVQCECAKKLQPARFFAVADSLVDEGYRLQNLTYEERTCSAAQITHPLMCLSAVLFHCMFQILSVFFQAF